ncbi:MAG TPA: peptide chain release factor N(5)-glutamine methyltransferase [Solirubrobacterales bacterium]
MTSTAADALSAAVDALDAAGCETARLDAELLLAQATGWDRAQLAAEPEARLPVGASREYGQMVRRRVRREPVAYILGRKGFRRIELLVDRRVLIPRPETELLVEFAVEQAARADGRALRFLDVGTGSGAVGLAVADEIPSASVMAIDTSVDALRVAQTNVDRLGLGDRVDVVAAGIASLPEQPFDCLLANLPYVSENEWERLQPEIREYEPRDALVAGPTGLEAIEALVAALHRRTPAGIALEVGAGQATAVVEMLAGVNYWAAVHRDLAGIERVVAALRVFT